MMAVTPPVAMTQMRAEKRSFFGRLTARMAALFTGAVLSARHLFP
jgi:hypothetical protein